MLNKMFLTNSKPVEPILVLSRDNFLMDPRAPNQTKALGTWSVMLGLSRPHMLHARRSVPVQTLQPITWLLWPQPAN